MLLKKVFTMISCKETKSGKGWYRVSVIDEDDGTVYFLYTDHEITVKRGEVVPVVISVSGKPFFVIKQIGE